MCVQICIYNINHFGTWILYLQLYAGHLHESRNYFFSLIHIQHLLFVQAIASVQKAFHLTLFASSNLFSEDQHTDNYINIYTPFYIYIIKIRIIYVCLYTQTHTHIHTLAFGFNSKQSACSAEDPGSISGPRNPLEKEMATYSSILAWRIPWTEEPGGL